MPYVIPNVSFVPNEDAEKTDRASSLSKREALQSMVPQDPSKISKDTVKAKKEKDFTWQNRSGKRAIRLSKEEAVKAVSKEKKADYDPHKEASKRKEPKELLFPIRIVLKKESNGKMEVQDFTGDIAGISFVNGKTESLVAFRQVMQIGAAGFRCYERETGAEVMPQSHGRTFIATGQTWNYGQPLPEGHPDIAVLEAKEKAGDEDEKAKSAEPKAKKVKIIENKGRVEKPTFDEAKISGIVKIMSKLRPGHKDDWVKNKPDCRRLSSLLATEYPDATWDKTVKKDERDTAWHVFNRDKLNEVQKKTTVFAMPLTNNVADILGTALAKNGARILRQKAEEMNIKEPSRDGQELIAQLVESGISMEDAKKLI